MTFKHIDELRASMTEEQKKTSDELFNKFYVEPFGDSEPVFCGPEARAMAEGPEALKKYYEDDDFLKPIDLSNWD